MQPKRSESGSGSAIPIRVRNGILVLSGYGIRVSVHHGRLLVSDNLLGNRRAIDLSRATCDLRRLVVLGHSGFVTLDALRWLSDIDAGYVQIDADGTLISCFAPSGVNDIRLRRAHVLAAGSRPGLAITRALLDAKLRGQASLLERRGLPKPAGTVRAIQERLTTDDPTELRYREAKAADTYWRALATTGIRFANRDAREVPEHWRRIGTRTVPGTHGRINAVNPVNAMLNYLYTILETETRIALLAQGLDPELGLFHSTKRFRNALALDVLEPLRPLVDEWVLDHLLAVRTFSRRDFAETRTGVVRLVPPIPQALAMTAPLWAERVVPLASWLATALGSIGDGTTARRLPTLPVIRSLAQSRLLRLLPQGCCDCAAPLPDYQQQRCASCAVVERAASVRRMTAAGQSSLARLRLLGRDPSHSKDASKRRTATLVQRHAEKRGWHRTKEQMALDVIEYRASLLPRLASATLGELVRATGLSKAQCSLMRRGLRVPHPKHWDALRAIEARATRR